MLFVQQVIAWFDESTIRYWYAAALSFGSVVVLALFSSISGLRQRMSESGEARWWHHPLLFVILMALTVTAFRWPILFYPHPLNPDESVRVAEAMKFLQDDLIPWRSVDTGTSGPLNAYALTLPALLGLPPDFATARLIGLVCTIGTVSFTFLTLRRMFDDGIAKTGVFPMLLFYCITRHPDFVHYASEHLAIMLLSAAIYLLVNYNLSAPAGRRDLFAAGVTLGAIPFAKLQAAPVAVLLFIGALSALKIERKKTGMLPARHVAALFGGTALVPAVIIGMVIWGGAFGDFWMSYIRSGMHFTSNAAVQPLFDVLSEFSQQKEFVKYVVGTGVMIFGGMSAAVVYELFKGRNLMRLSIACIYLAANIHIVLKPGRIHMHYLLFLIPPLILMAGMSLGSVVRSLAEQQRRKLSFTLLMVFAGIAAIVQIPLDDDYYHDSYDVTHAGDYYAADPWASLDPKASVVNGLILRIARPGEKMVIWGWAPKYFVSTGLLPGTRETVTQNQIDDSPLRGYYRRRFLDDLKAARPAVFVDSVSSLGWHYCEREKYGHETFAELAELIRKSYTLLYEFGPTPDDAVRVYALNERLQS